MLTKGYVLSNDVDFDNAMFFGLDVKVTMDDHVYEFGAPIGKHNENIVVIGDNYYFKGFCEFQIA